MAYAGNSKLMKKINRLQVFDCIRKSESISKAEIRNETGLTPTTIIEITGSMLSEGVILDNGTGISTGGRPSQMVSLNPGYAYFIGAEIEPEYIRTALISFDMKIVHQKCIDIYDFSFENISHILCGTISELIEGNSILKDKIHGIGIAVPALVSREGHVELAPNLNWSGVDIKSLVESEFNLPVIVGNEAKFSAVAERYTGFGRYIDNFMAINIKSGIGSGIYIDGHLYSGTSGNSGEIGHITVKEDGPLCGCGDYGCLETMAATPSIISRARMYKKQGENSLLFDRFENVDDINLTNIIGAYRDGDELCGRILQSASKYIAIGLSNAINLINPQLIILGGDLVLYDDVLLPKVLDITSKKALKCNREVCEIRVSELKKDSSVLGAAIVSINSMMNYTDI